MAETGPAFPPPTDAQLEELNAALDWHAGTLLPDGRLLGRLAGTPGKRVRPQTIPDRRIVRLNDLLPLAGLSLLEIGCFEGVHTLGLKRFCEDVTAIDVRPQNVLKTLARLSWHGAHAKVFQADAEALGAAAGRYDLIFHFGVLYHLKAPVEHLAALGRMARHLYLDTHVAPAGADAVEFEAAGARYRGIAYKEQGWRDPFSGARERSVWLEEASLDAALAAAGFASRRMLERREERNGPRLLVLASKTES